MLELVGFTCSNLIKAKTQTQGDFQKFPVFFFETFHDRTSSVKLIIFNLTIVDRSILYIFKAFSSFSKANSEICA